MATLGLTPTTAKPEEFPVQSDAFNLTKVTSAIVTALGLLGPGAYAVFGDTENVKDSVIFSVAGVAIASLFSIALIVAADLRSRASATAASGKETATDSEANSDTLKEVAPGLALTHISATGAVAAAKTGQGPQRLPVIAVGWDSKKGKTYFLIGQAGGNAEWQSDEKISTFYFQADPSHFFPTTS